MYLVLLFITTPPLIVVSGSGLCRNFAGKQTRSRKMAARPHLSASRGVSGLLLIVQQATRHGGGSVPTHRFKSRGHGRRCRVTTHTLANFRHNCRPPILIEASDMTRSGPNVIHLYARGFLTGAPLVRNSERSELHTQRVHMRE